MNEKIAQTAPNSGASNAADFQPPTQNPQNVQGSVVQQQNGLQGVTNTQEFFNDTQNSSIQITSEPAPARAVVEPTNDAATLAILAVVAIVVGVILFRLSSRLDKKSSVALMLVTDGTKTKEEDGTEPAQEASKQAATVQTAKDATAKPTKKPAKKATAKKNKRKHR